MKNYWLVLGIGLATLGASSFGEILPVQAGGAPAVNIDSSTVGLNFIKQNGGFYAPPTTPEQQRLNDNVFNLLQPNKPLPSQDAVNNSLQQAGVNFNTGNERTGTTEIPPTSSLPLAAQNTPLILPPSFQQSFQSFVNRLPNLGFFR